MLLIYILYIKKFEIKVYNIHTIQNHFYFFIIPKKSLSVNQN